VRTKAILMSTGLAASVWLTGCQSSSSSRLAAHGTSCTSCAAALDCQDSLHADLNRLPGEKAEKTARLSSTPNKAPSTIPATSSSRSAGGPKVIGTGTKGASAAPLADNSCCAAQTGSAAGREAVIYCLPGAPTTTPIPSATPSKNVAKVPPVAPVAATPGQTSAPLPENLPPPDKVSPPSEPASNAAPTTLPDLSVLATSQSPVASIYGPGVEVVPSQGGETSPSAAREPVDAKKNEPISMGQANNYQILVGQVYQFRRMWKLRFTAVESDDKYGGSFTLVGDNLDHLKDGQIVRVEGSVLPSHDRTSGAQYQVNRLTIVEPDVN
jgi:hypothetical protein